jgi:hypothetical protein
MSSLRIRWSVLALLAVFTLLFSPAPDETLGAPIQDASRTLGARSLAPAVREGNVSARPKFDQNDARVGEPWLLQPAYTSAALMVATLPLLWGFVAAGLRSGNRQRLFGLRSLAPRAPPSLLSA